MHQVARVLAALLITCLLSGPATAQRKKKKEKTVDEEKTQQLETTPDLPAGVFAETQRLGFLVSPLSSKGLLSQQTRDAVRALMKNSHGAQLVKLRAFVAGTGDMRRVQTIVAEELAGKRQILPVLSVVQVGQLPLEGAQILIEATTIEKKPVNANGVAFFSGQQVAKEGKIENPLEAVLPLAEKSLANLKTAAAAAGVPQSAMMRVTCLASSLADYSAVSRKISEEFPQATATVVQLQRGPLRPVVECEGIGRLSGALQDNVKLLNPSGLPASANYSQVALVKSPRVLFTAGQMGFGGKDDDIRLAFDRLKRVLEQMKSSYADVFFSSYYPLTNPIVEQIRAQRFNYFDKSRPPASTLILFEGLPSHDASFAFEVVAAAN